MNIVVDIIHPAHVHFFKNFIHIMEERGHNVLVTSRNKDVAKNLLDAYDIEYCTLSTCKSGLLNMGYELIYRDIKLYLKSQSFSPDIFIGEGNPFITHVATLMRKTSILFTNTEHAKLINNSSFPFASVICTPSCFNKNLGKKHIRYNGYLAIAYLHPNYFTPNPTVLEELDLKEDEPFIILRFVSWEASHDVGHHGIQNKIEFVKELEKYGRVLITSEGDLGPEFEKYKITVSPEKLHDLLYYATLYIGEGATTASECAILGTHAIYVNTLRLGYLDEQEEKYNLTYTFSDPKNCEKDALDKAISLLKRDNLWEEGKKKRKLLLSDKVDVTDFMVNFIGKYKIK
ncbi:DUF354 domain-containing protein [Methanohalophilus mahii]|uniref:DUF354 domain-containing protein n=1 Tax=Methanohalophilus mahii (strain ATCC 35705 / DSM 5219 / SLP) TaxID=547558 RepID=D5E8X2_METMS|nr:DUF354 domain-containing protein [Methanohalophilus mahii]ADE35631.1 protein of unknown function DUF354 [Methanohalophilus mahii DSM 5219]